MLERTLLLLGALIVSAFTAMAQATTAHDRYIADVQGLSDLAREKALVNVLNAWDPTCTFHIRTAEGQVELFVHRPFERSGLAADLAVHGFRLNDLQHWNAAIDAMEPVPVDTGDGPVFIETGDRKADNAAYDRAKARWIATHPERNEDITPTSTR